MKTKILFKISLKTEQSGEMAESEAILYDTGQIQLKMVAGSMMMKFCYFVKIYMSRANKDVLLCSN